MPRPNSRDPKQSPAALLGQRLRRLRQAAGFTSQEAGARAMGYAREVVTKAEGGERVPTDQVFRTYLETFHATPEQAESLTEDLELARNLADPVIPEFAEPWLDVEPEAAIIRAWALDVLPGLTQTYDYVFAMFLKGGLSEDRAAARAAARVKRAEILDGAEPTRLTAIVYEPLLHRLVGTPEVMVTELEHLLEMSQRPNVVIQVVREPAYFPGHNGQFHIASGRTIPDTLVMVNIEDHTVTTPAVVDRAIALFEDIRGYALTVAESRVLIGAVTTTPITRVGDTFVMRMFFQAHGDYQMINHVVEFEPDRLVGWEPQAGDGHPDQGSGEDHERWGHRWSYALTPDGPDATMVTERYDCSRAPEEERIGMQDGAVWIDAMTGTLKRLDALCAPALS